MSKRHAARAFKRSRSDAADGAARILEGPWRSTAMRRICSSTTSSQYSHAPMSGRPEVVVVPGASAGVGRAVVRRFAREAAHIALLARGVDGLEAARREVEEAGGKALVL